MDKQIYSSKTTIKAYIRYLKSEIESSAYEPEMRKRWESILKKVEGTVRYLRRMGRYK